MVIIGGHHLIMGKYSEMLLKYLWSNLQVKFQCVKPETHLPERLFFHLEAGQVHLVFCTLNFFFTMEWILCLCLNFVFAKKQHDVKRPDEWKSKHAKATTAGFIKIWEFIVYEQFRSRRRMSQMWLPANGWHKIHETSTVKMNSKWWVWTQNMTTYVLWWKKYISVKILSTPILPSLLKPQFSTPSGQGWFGSEDT